jgi:rfaE bifunctional protein nucleotidyltransferase chain/domain
MGQVVNREALADAIAAARLAGRRIVLTNGVFDLLHVGHARLLAECRAHGDLVVVGVNSDASVRALAKGPDRPIVPEADRAELVAAIGAVDLVIIFDEVTAHDLVTLVRPDVYIKGGDYRPDGEADDDPRPVLPEATLVREVGGTVVLVAVAPGRSTTALARKIAGRTP